HRIKPERQTPNTFASCTLPVKARPLIGPKAASVRYTYNSAPQIIPRTAAPTAPTAPAIKTCGTGVAAATPSESLVRSPVCLAPVDSAPVALMSMTTGPVTPAELKAPAIDVTAGGSVDEPYILVLLVPNSTRFFAVLTIAAS
ncbi:hypothetical protein HII31_01698, partial [Pseudocercospora fuligena]